MTTRLESISIQLASEFAAAGIDRQRRAVVEACMQAATRTNLERQEVDAALDFFRRRIGDREALRIHFQAIATKNDNEYLMRQEEGSDEIDRTSLALFSKARAATAFSFALADKPEEFHEVLYEAIASGESPSELLLAIRGALR